MDTCRWSDHPGVSAPPGVRSEPHPALHLRHFTVAV
jgi:hypothetical protein